ncbi:PIN domain-containing protein [Dolichospermum sp. ST_con]|nr:PIN domain-containing protein [Dolichospermum sp. ST_con]MDD1438679.1 PIN domain-containing protein [Dolichospermum sp. ST_sed10]
MILYIETNFLMAVAKGRDIDAAQLLRNLSPLIRLAIPAICYVEVINTYRIDKQNQLKFQAEMEKQINEAMRDKISVHADLFKVSLERASIENLLLLNDVQDRLYEIINLLTENSEIINFDNNIIKDISDNIFIATETLLIKNDLMDNLILQCIVSHANQHPHDQKVFISGNTKDFGKKEVREVLNSAKIKYFSNTRNFLGWLDSQCS